MGEGRAGLRHVDWCGFGKARERTPRVCGEGLSVAYLAVPVGRPHPCN